MSREESSALLYEILEASRALVELGEPELGDPPSRLCQELRIRRRVLLDRLRDSEHRGQER